MVEFRHTGAPQQYVVPQGVTAVKIACRGGAGSDPRFSPLGGGYNGGYSEGILNVSPGDVLHVYVAGAGSQGGGGGASDVRYGGTGLEHRRIVGAGAAGWSVGNQAAYLYGQEVIQGGDAGGAVGSDGSFTFFGSGGSSGYRGNGRGGSQSAGGLGGPFTEDLDEPDTPRVAATRGRWGRGGHAADSIGQGGGYNGGGHPGQFDPGFSDPDQTPYGPDYYGGGGGGYFGGGGGSGAVRGGSGGDVRSQVGGGGAGSGFIGGVLNGYTDNGYGEVQPTEPAGDASRWHGLVVITPAAAPGQPNPSVPDLGPDDGPENPPENFQAFLLFNGSSDLTVTPEDNGTEPPVEPPVEEEEAGPPTLVLDFVGASRSAMRPLFESDADPVSGLINYRVVVVDMDGTPLIEVENAVLDPIKWAINDMGDFSFSVPTGDSKIRDISVPDREVQVWRGGRFLWWGVIVRANGDDTSVQFQCKTLEWYFTRRIVGKFPREGVFEGAQFQFGVGSWRRGNVNNEGTITKSISRDHGLAGGRSMRLVWNPRGGPILDGDF